MKPTACLLIASVMFATPSPSAAQDKSSSLESSSSVMVSGLIIPRDHEGMYVRNPEGQFEIEWTDQTQVALDVNTRQLAGIKGNVFQYKVHSSNQTIDYRLPEGPITGVVNVRGGKFLQQDLKVAEEEYWISERGFKAYFGEKPKSEQLPSEENLRFIGLWDPTTNPRTLSINDTKYEISLKKGGQTNALLFNVIDTKDCRPFVNRATVIGHRQGDVIVAHEIHLLPIGDQTTSDDPKLPRYLFIGDSISGNYDKGLREELQGQFNLHHPPTNCGPSGKGKNSVVEWLGGYTETGRHWDVISFNFGHWDAGNNKETYQANLEAVLSELKKTKAKLIWVTTCPVPKGYPAAGDLTMEGKAPSRTSGVMEKYLNPWALEVMKRHPEITVCDQWQFVKDHEDHLYRDWWTGQNVHFSGEQADALGKFLAEHVTEITTEQ